MLIINSPMMMNIFDGVFEKNQQPPVLPIYGSFLSGLSMAYNKEGGKKTKKKKRLKGGEEACLLSHGTYIKQKQKGGNERVREMSEKRLKDRSIGLVKGREKYCSGCLGGIENGRLSVLFLLAM